MRLRDLVILGALLLIGGFAAADVLRDGDEGASPTTETFVLPPLPPPPGPQPQREAPDEYPRGVLSGGLVVGSADDCSLRVLGLAGGVERPVPPTLPLAEPCTVWASPRGGLIAYPSEEFGGGFEVNFPFLAVGEPSGPVVWRPDGERAAWCRSATAGVEFDVGTSSTRELGGCPAAYTPAGDVAFIAGRQLLAEHRTLLRTTGRIRYASWGNDGSIGLYLDNGRFERWQGDRLDDAVEIPGRFGDPVFTPDNCAALFQDVDQAWFEVFALDCFEAERPDLLIFGDSTSVAWSPDGRWIAVAYSDRIGFHRVATGIEEFSWPERAAALAWVAD